MKNKVIFYGEIMENIGVVIKEKRKKMGTTQEDLAKKIGISRNSLKSWELGRHSPRFKNLLKALEILGIDISEKSKGKNDENNTISTN